MKTWIAIICAALLASQASAVLLSEGTKELGVSGMVDFHTVDGSQIDLELTYGYFVAYGLEAGARLHVQDSDSASLIALFGFVEYNFYTETIVVPFVGAGLGLASADVEGGGDETAFIIDGVAGAKVFLAENVALSAQMHLDIATEDIYIDDDHAESIDLAFTLGLRFFFP